MSDGKIESKRAPEPVGAYPHARKVGDFIFYSGMGPRSRGSKDIPGVTLNEKGEIESYDIATQCHSVFNNLKMVVEESGASWMDVVDVTVFLTNMKADFPTYNKIYAEYFKENQPCRTTLEIKSLPTPIAIEVKAVAYVGPK
jgi:2-aminomuconate deaminase